MNLQNSDGVKKLGKQGMMLTLAGIFAALLILYAAIPAFANTIVPISNDNAGAGALAEAMVKAPATLQGAKFKTIPPYGTPHGTSGALSYFPTDGEDFGIMTTGNVSFAGTGNTSGGAGVNLGGRPLPERGITAYDVSVLELDLLAPTDSNCLRLDFAFYSEEYPEYVNSFYNDAFIAELDRTTWTSTPDQVDDQIRDPDNFAFDSNGEVVSINSTGSTSMNDINPGGTTYDGSTVLLEAATKVSPGEHKLYLSIFDQGDGVLDSAAFVDNIRFEKVRDPDAGCKPGAQPVEGVKRTPLIIVPGAGGSILVDAADNDRELWMRLQELYDNTGEDEHLRELKLDQYGNSQGGSDVRAKDLVRQVSVNLTGVLPDFIPDYYKDYDGYITTIETLEVAGYEEGKDLFVFPYDFRKGVEDARDYEGKSLNRKIQDIIDETGSPQVDIVAHSMGGLVTCDALSKPESVGKVRKVLTLGTPVLGATKGLGILQYQMPCFVETPYVPVCLSNKATTQEIMDTFPGGHLLLPSPNYDAAEGPPLVIDHDGRADSRTGEQDYDEWSAILHEDPARNDALIEYAKEFHEANDDLQLADPSVQFARVVGDGVDTPVQIREYEYPECYYVSGTPTSGGTYECESKIGYEILKGNGDVTVPRHSADLYNPETGFDKRGQNNYGYTPNVYAHDVDHEGLYKDDRVLAFANAYFGGKQQGPQNQSYGAMSFAEPSPREPQDPRLVQDENQKMGIQSIEATESGEPTETANLAEEFGLGSTPESFSGIELETRGPVRGFVEDDGVLGSFPGQPEDAIFQTIPGGTYNAIHETQTFFLNESGSYMGKLEVTGEEAVRLRVRTYTDDKMNGQAVFNVQDATDASLHLGFGTSQDLGSLRLLVDDDGDGDTDRELAPDSIVTGPAADDTDPPTTTASFRTVAPKQASVTLSAKDDPRGSGVSSTQYFVEGGSESRLYTESFTVPFGKTVVFWSVDRAGNTELPRKVVVDDAPNTLESAELISDGDHIRRYIDPRGDEDWFRFEVDGSSTYRAQLLGLPADYDLELYDKDGNKVTAPYRRGKQTEDVRSKLAAGAYYLRVAGHGGAWNPDLHYQLKLQTLAG